jgi:hypothetical protein
MSADNGVYILESVAADGGSEFRVAHAQAIENANYIPPGFSPDRDRQFWNLEYTWAIWHRSPVFQDKDTVMQRALEMEDELDICEYGVCHEYMPRPFPTNDEAMKFAKLAETATASWSRGSLADAIMHCNEYSQVHQARQGCAVARLQRAARAALDLSDKYVSNDKVIEATLAELREATELCEHWMEKSREP